MPTWIYIGYIWHLCRSTTDIVYLLQQLQLHSLGWDTLRCNLTVVIWNWLQAHPGILHNPLSSTGLVRPLLGTNSLLHRFHWQILLHHRRLCNWHNPLQWCRLRTSSHLSRDHSVTMVAKTSTTSASSMASTYQCLYHLWVAVGIASQRAVPGTWTPFAQVKCKSLVSLVAPWSLAGVLAMLSEMLNIAALELMQVPVLASLLIIPNCSRMYALMLIALLLMIPLVLSLALVLLLILLPFALRVCLDCLK